MGDFERARIYYFEALKNSFDSYTDSSIINFKKEEDRYIEDLIKENLRNKDQYIEYLIEEYNVKIKKIEEEYKQLKEKLHHKIVNTQETKAFIIQLYYDIYLHQLIL